MAANSLPQGDEAARIQKLARQLLDQLYNAPGFVGVDLADMTRAVMEESLVTHACVTSRDQAQRDIDACLNQSLPLE